MARSKRFLPRFQRRVVRLALGSMMAASSAIVLPTGADLGVRPAFASDNAGRVLLPGAGHDLRYGGLTGSYLAAAHASRQDDLRRSADYMYAAFQRHGRNGYLMHRAFVLSMAVGEIDRALPLASALNAVDPTDHMSAMALALAAAESGDFQKGLDYLDAMNPMGLSTVVVPVVSAWLALSQDDVERAIARLSPLQERRGMETLVELQEGLLLEVAGRPDSARATYERTIERVGAEAAPGRLIQALGRLYREAGENEAFEALYEDAFGVLPEERAPADEPIVVEAKRGGEIATDPQEGLAEALFHLATALNAEGVADLALPYVQWSLRLRPDSDITRILLGEMLTERGDHNLALNVFESVDPDSPLNLSAGLSAARMMDRLDRRGDAIDFLNALEDDYPGRPEIPFLIGDLKRIDRQFDAAVEAYDRTAEISPDLETENWSFLYRRGMALERADRWERAERDLQRAVALNGTHGHLLNYLGYSWIDRGINIDEGEHLLLRAIELEPDDGYIIDSVGWVYFRTGRMDQAVSWLERAVELLPADATVNDHLGDAYWMVGREREARYQWRRALQHVDDDPDLAATIEGKLADGLDETGVVADRVATGDADQDGPTLR
ncbi:tetratricopeptide repeat protein [Fodinicurvata sp. EGI_FJ10296]|uniref:tetratricopeptide repeat protein n=1 Tax=Fodinicurvata sp. EGI_FJ10296 TaxID=3231908 RepID=UPI00345500E4